MVGGGWVGGGKIKNKDQLSLAEARVEAELGNKGRRLYKLRKFLQYKIQLAGRIRGYLPQAGN